MNDARLIEAYRRAVVPTRQAEDEILARLLADPRPHRATWLVAATVVLAAAALVLWIAGLFTGSVEHVAATPDQAVHDGAPPREPAPAITTPASLPPSPVATPSEPPPLPSRPATPVRRPPPAATADIAEEARLVAAAQAALRDGDPTRALASLDEHVRRFPKGDMQREREALRVIAECNRGHASEVATTARALVADPALAAHASRIRHACGL
jgi:hypothetical protein